MPCEPREGPRDWRNERSNARGAGRIVGGIVLPFPSPNYSSMFALTGCISKPLVFFFKKKSFLFSFIRIQLPALQRHT